MRGIPWPAPGSEIAWLAVVAALLVAAGWWLCGTYFAALGRLVLVLGVVGVSLALVAHASGL